MSACRLHVACRLHANACEYRHCNDRKNLLPWSTSMHTRRACMRACAWWLEAGGDARAHYSAASHHRATHVRLQSTGTCQAVVVWAAPRQASITAIHPSPSTSSCIIAAYGHRCSMTRNAACTASPPTERGEQRIGPKAPLGSLCGGNNDIREKRRAGLAGGCHPRHTTHAATGDTRAPEGGT